MLPEQTDIEFVEAKNRRARLIVMIGLAALALT